MSLVSNPAAEQRADQSPVKDNNDGGVTASFIHGEDEPGFQAAAVSTAWLREHAQEFMGEWTRAGLTKYVDLPMICVLGDTSSGKSSVLSSLIGLELPSSSKLTTKCPVLIQLQHTGLDEQPRARIDIQWHENRCNSSSFTTSSPRQRKRDIERQVTEDWPKPKMPFQ